MREVVLLPLIAVSTLLTLTSVNSFSIVLTPCYRINKQATSRLSSSNKGVSVVSVCTGELCLCQEEGFSADDILNDLRSRNLPYTVDETVCLGACGPNAMVVIDFEDGNSFLTAGMDETLLELGLSQQTVSIPSTEIEQLQVKVEDSLNTVLIPSSQSTTSVKAGDVENKGNVLLSEGTSTIQEHTAETQVTNDIVQKRPARKRPEIQLDVRDRMRAEAADDKEGSSSPWLTAASYLAKKAGEKLFG